MLTGTSFADDIRYLSLHDNSYLRYFKGHKKKCVLALASVQMPDGADVLLVPKRRVVSLAMSPQDDTFLSAARDDTVRLWDLRAPSAQVSQFVLPEKSRPSTGLTARVTVRRAC